MDLFDGARVCNSGLFGRDDLFPLSPGVLNAFASRTLYYYLFWKVCGRAPPLYPIFLLPVPLLLSHAIYTEPRSCLAWCVIRMLSLSYQ